MTTKWGPNRRAVAAVGVEDGPPVAAMWWDGATSTACAPLSYFNAAEASSCGPDSCWCKTRKMKTRIQKTLDKMIDSAVLAMALEEMEFCASSNGSRMQTKGSPLTIKIRTRHLPSGGSLDKLRKPSL